MRCAPAACEAPDVIKAPQAAIHGVDCARKVRCRKLCHARGRMDGGFPRFWRFANPRRPEVGLEPQPQLYLAGMVRPLHECRRRRRRLLQRWIDDARRHRRKRAGRDRGQWKITNGIGKSLHVDGIEALGTCLAAGGDVGLVRAGTARVLTKEKCRSRWREIRKAPRQAAASVAILQSRDEAGLTRPIPAHREGDSKRFEHARAAPAWGRPVLIAARLPRAIRQLDRSACRSVVARCLTNPQSSLLTMRACVIPEASRRHVQPTHRRGVQRIRIRRRADR